MSAKYSYADVSNQSYVSCFSCLVGVSPGQKGPYTLTIGEKEILESMHMILSLLKFTQTTLFSYGFNTMALTALQLSKKKLLETKVPINPDKI